MKKKIFMIVTRRVLLAGLLAAPLPLTGCGSGTVEIAGGANTQTPPEQTSARAKAAEKSEDAIFAKLRKLR